MDAREISATLGLELQGYREKGSSHLIQYAVRELFRTQKSGDWHQQRPRQRKLNKSCRMLARQVLVGKEVDAMMLFSGGNTFCGLRPRPAGPRCPSLQNVA